MGNLVETSIFIKDKGDPTKYSEITGKRTDQIFIRSKETIHVVGIGLCTPIHEEAKAFVNITDYKSEKQILDETFKLKANHNGRIYNFYNFDKPVTFLKGTYYSITVDIHGDSVHTYEKTQQFLTHREIIIDLTREKPEIWDLPNGQTKLMLNKPKSERRRVDKHVSIKDDDDGLRKVASDPTANRTSISRLSKITSNKRMSDLPDDSPEPVGLSKNLSLMRNPSNATTLTSFDSPTMFKGKSLRRAKSHNINLIAGILFKRAPAIRGGCC